MSQTILTYHLSAEAKEAGISFSSPRALDAGYDLPSLLDAVIKPQESALIRTGLHVAIPEGWVGFIKDRSSVAVKGGVISAGVIDSAYRGEVKVLMFNRGADDLVFKQGDRVAQLVVLLHLPGNECIEVPNLEELGSTDRAHGGFGSTGQ